MWQKSYSLTTKDVTKEQIWNIWQDVKNWNKWDDSVTESEIFGKFEPGAKGFLIPSGGPKTNFTMTGCKYQKSFTDTTFLPLCQLDFIHFLEETSDGLKITHQIQITGLLSFLFSKIIGEKLAQTLPEAVTKLVQLAKTKY